ncbi:MAG: hypothetical protein U5J63_10070 [Fodinibius sp.]|nr:hypothetical protein [Fodinibius sp.]
MKNVVILLTALLTITMGITDTNAQVQQAPDRSMGEGPYDRLIIRGATLVDGTGSPPRGPIDVVVEDNKITSVQSGGISRCAHR